jgi:hypothetical protein
VTPSIRKRLTAALRQYHAGGWWETTAVITLPRRVSATVPRWSPGPGYVEAMTATVWAQPSGAGYTHAVVVLADPVGPSVKISGTVSVHTVLGLGGLCDKPHRIRWQAEAPTSTLLATDHPAVVYHDRYQRLAEEFDQLLRRLGRTRHLLPEQPRVSATPHGGIQAALPICIEPGRWWRYDVHAHAAVLAGVLRRHGRGTRVRFHPRTAADVIDPMYHQARRRLASNPAA